MRRLIAYTLLAGGGFCAGIALAVALTAEQGQQASRQEWEGARTALTSTVARAPLGRGVVARLRFPSLNREVFILDDREESNLKRGPVWLGVTARLGSNGNSVIAGHRDTHFRFLKDAKHGDRFLLDDGIKERTYEITGIRIVNPGDRSLLAPSNRETVTLVTCYPFYGIGRATRRMIIRAEPANERVRTDNF